MYSSIKFFINIFRKIEETNPKEKKIVNKHRIHQLNSLYINIFRTRFKVK